MKYYLEDIEVKIINEFKYENEIWVEVEPAEFKSIPRETKKDNLTTKLDGTIINLKEKYRYPKAVRDVKFWEDMSDDELSYQEDGILDKVRRITGSKSFNSKAVQEEYKHYQTLLELFNDIRANRTEERAMNDGKKMGSK